MKQTVVGRIEFAPNGQRVIRPISNPQHAQQVLDHQEAQRLFMVAARAFMFFRSEETLAELEKRFKALST